PGNPPSIASLTVEGQVATLELSDFISTGAWTVITHIDSETSTRIGYLPADVNNDKFSGANDLLYLIDVLNGVVDPTTPAYQTDIDRSGATNANDVLRAIDLLNGAGAFEEWLGASLPN
ncbi:MAG: hypothetical protein IID36_14415, partial [Planctomycetes bacterium]|nr:hypothetical protein [Planctomycetota bacterium]